MVDTPLRHPSPLAGEGGAQREALGGRGGVDATERRRQHRAHARAMRQVPTDAEAALWRLLRAKRLDHFKFRRQFPIGPFIADFACPAARLIIEADGSQHADNASDERRTQWLTARGWRVLRLWNADVLKEPEGVWRTIHAALTSPLPPTPAAWAPPSPARGEG